MNYEVEIKARVRDQSALYTRLENLGARFERQYQKDDRYFHRFDQNGNFAGELRLRLDGDAAYVTHKQRGSMGAMESNREIEFSVDPWQDFLLLIADLGYSAFVEKHKLGRAYRLDGLLLEVSHVEHLGDFLEIEALLDEHSTESELELSRQAIWEMLHKLGLSQADVEPRSYTSLIAAALGVSDPRP